MFFGGVMRWRCTTPCWSIFIESSIVSQLDAVGLLWERCYCTLFLVSLAMSTVFITLLKHIIKLRKQEFKVMK